MMEFIREALLVELSDYGVASILENRTKLLLRSHYTIVCLVYYEFASCHIFFDEYKSSLSIITLDQSRLLSLLQELNQVIISEIAETPLDPDTVISVLIIETFQTHLVESSAL